MVAPSTTAPVKAAQYVRMSTERQDYSIEFQTASNIEYALERGYEIVAIARLRSSLRLVAVIDARRVIGMAAIGVGAAGMGRDRRVDRLRQG